MKRMNFLDGLLVSVAMAFLLFFGIGMLLSPQESFSEEENRALVTWQNPSWRSVTDGSFSERLGRLYRDQLPCRSLLISLKAQGEILLGKRENNGILLGKEGYLMARGEYGDLSVAEKNWQALLALSESCESEGIPFSSLWIPRSADVMSRWLPSSYPSEAADELYRWLHTQGEMTPRDLLREAAEQGVPVYYRTDHHLTTEGAYLLYCALGERLDYTPMPREHFLVKCVSDDFLGSADSAIGGIAPQADRIELYRYDGDEQFCVIDRTSGETRQGFYDWSALEKKDQYSIFLGGNFAHLQVRDAARSDKPRLLLIKDSFANAMIPFFAIHFDIEVVDARYLADVPKLDSYDRVLVLQGVHTLATEASLSRGFFLLLVDKCEKKRYNG